MNYANGSYASYGYDSRSRLTSVLHRTSAGATITSEAYGYDAVSDVISRVADGVTTTFGYDLIDQLTSEARSGYSASYAYDANGNRLARTVNGVTENYSYDSADKLLSIAIGGVTQRSYSYDAAGRTTAITTGGGTTSFLYDFEDRLIRITFPGGGTNTFSYNGLSSRVAKADSIGSHSFAKSGANSGSVLLSDGFASYTGNVSERRGGVSRFYHSSGLQSNGFETNSSQGTSSARSWDAWGNLVSQSGSSSSPFGWGGGFGFERDVDSGLFSLDGGGYFDPNSGRGLVRDIFAVRFNQRSGGYETAEGNPVGEPRTPVPSKTPVHNLAENNGGTTFRRPQKTTDDDYTPPAGGLGLSFPTMPWKMRENMRLAQDIGADVAVFAGHAFVMWAMFEFGFGVAEEAIAAIRLLPLIGKGACFEAGTKVVMADGTTKNIEDVRAGDWVLSRDEATGETANEPVTRTFGREAAEIVTIRLADSETISSTPEHPIWVIGRGWTAAGALESGCEIATSTGIATTVTSVQLEHRNAKVFNFEVAKTHTYFVGSKSCAVWVHNECRPSFNQIAQKIRRGQAPPSVTRVDRDIVDRDYGMPHVHLDGDKHALYMNGTWKHGGRALTNAEKKWLKENGFSIPKD